MEGRKGETTESSFILYEYAGAHIPERTQFSAQADKHLDASGPR